MNSYWVLIAMFGLIGLGNTVYHPADYALLSRHVAPERMSQAYSVHTFAGMLGSAAAPGAVLFLHGLFGWRGAFLGAAVDRRRWPRCCCCSSPTASRIAPPHKPRDADAGADRLAAAADRADPDEFRVLPGATRSPASACRTSRWWRSARSTAPAP